MKTFIQLVEENGGFVKEVDGFYYWKPMDSFSIFTEHQLRAIAEELEKRNKKWNEDIEKHLGQHDGALAGARDEEFA